MSLLPILLLWCSLFAVFGSLVGGLAGLIPGLHPNTLAVAFNFLPIALFFSSLPIDAEAAPILLGCFLVSLLLSHSMTEIIVTATLGVANDDTIIALLPSQRLHALGRGDSVIECTLIGGLGAVLIFSFLLVPLRIVLGSPIDLYSQLRPLLGIILIAISAFVIVSSKRYSLILFSFLFFIVAGILGIIVLTLEIPASVDAELFGRTWSDESSNFLLPVFTGFFALPGLILPKKSTIKADFKKTASEKIEVGKIKPLVRSIIPATLVGWLPGITNAYATSLAMHRKKEGADTIASACEYMITYSATNIGGSLNSILAMSTISRYRNGILESIGSHFTYGQLVWSDVGQPPISMFAFLWAACIGAIGGAFLCKKLGSRILKSSSFSQKGTLRFSLLIFIISLVLLLSGPIGVLLLFSCFILAVWAVQCHVSRIHLMGFMLVPTIVYFIAN